LSQKNFSLSLSRGSQANILELFFVKIPSDNPLGRLGVIKEVAPETLKRMIKAIRKAKNIHTLNLDCSG